MVMFPKSVVDRFKHLSQGQAFHGHMKLEKVEHPQDKEFCDHLYNADEAKAKATVMSRLDRKN